MAVPANIIYTSLYIHSNRHYTIYIRYYVLDNIAWGVDPRHCGAFLQESLTHIVQWQRVQKFHTCSKQFRLPIIGQSAACSDNYNTSRPHTNEYVRTQTPDQPPQCISDFVFFSIQQGCESQHEWCIAVHMHTHTVSQDDVCSKQIPYYVITDNDTPWTIGRDHAMY